MLNGNDDPKDMLAGLKDGIYAVGLACQVDITNGKLFSCTGRTASVTCRRPRQRRNAD
jgi:predicted Zn-dependent protease